MLPIFATLSGMTERDISQIEEEEPLRDPYLEVTNLLQTTEDLTWGEMIFRTKDMRISIARGLDEESLAYYRVTFFPINAPTNLTISRPLGEYTFYETGEFSASSDKKLIPGIHNGNYFVGTESSKQTAREQAAKVVDLLESKIKPPQKPKP